MNGIARALNPVKESSGAAEISVDYDIMHVSNRPASKAGKC